MKHLSQDSRQSDEIRSWYLLLLLPICLVWRVDHNDRARSLVFHLSSVSEVLSTAFLLPEITMDLILMPKFILLSRCFDDGLFNNISVKNVKFWLLRKALFQPEGNTKVGFCRYI
jgi:hypothetical protein